MHLDLASSDCYRTRLNVKCFCDFGEHTERAKVKPNKAKVMLVKDDPVARDGRWVCIAMSSNSPKAMKSEMNKINYVYKSSQFERHAVEFTAKKQISGHFHINH